MSEATSDKGYTEVTVDDGKGEPKMAQVKDDFVLICDGTCQVDSMQTWSNGTVQITIKGRKV